MTRFSISLIAANIALVLTLYATWPRPHAVLELARIGKGSTLVVPSFYWSTAGMVPPRTIDGWNKWVVVRSKENGKSCYQFVESQTGELSAQWTPDRLDDNHHFENGRFDYKGRFLVEEGPIDRWDRLQPKRIHRLDPTSMHHERIVFPRTSDALASNLCDDGSTLFEFYGGADKPLSMKVFDFDDMSLINEKIFPNRIGFVKSYHAQVACNEFAISHDGSQFALTESWDHEHRMSSEQIEVFDTQTGKLVSVFSVADSVGLSRFDRPATVDESKREYPIKSSQTGHTTIYFSPDGDYLSTLHARRMKHQFDSAWQMDGTKFDCFEIQTGRRDNTVAWARMNRDVDIERPIVDGGSMDGSRFVWLSKFPRWDPKTAQLTDVTGHVLGGWKTFPLSVCMEESDELGGLPVPSTNGIVIFSYSEETEVHGQSEMFWQLMPTQLAPLQPKPDHLHRVYWYNFDTTELLVLARSNKTKGELEYRQLCQPNKVSLLFNGLDIATLEIWDLPVQKPKWLWAGLVFATVFGSSLVVSSRLWSSCSVN